MYLPVYNTIFVQIKETNDNLCRVKTSLSFFKLSNLLNLVHKIASVNVLHHEIQSVLKTSSIIDHTMQSVIKKQFIKMFVVDV